MTFTSKYKYNLEKFLMDRQTDGQTDQNYSSEPHKKTFNEFLLKNKRK